MKNISIITSLILIVSVLLVSCAPTIGGQDTQSGNGEMQNQPGGNAEDGSNSESGGNAEGGGNVESGGNAEGGGNAESGGNAEGNDNAESGGNTENEADDSDTEGNPEKPPVGTAVGNSFGHLSVQGMNGEIINTANYSGKIIILNIWATRCPPCKAELPDFNRIASEYSDDVVIIAAHEAYNKQSAISYVNTNFPDTKIIFAFDSVYNDAYYAAGGDGYIPQTAIIDRNGIIVYSDSGQLSHSALVELIEANK